jgi:hypothetical protein
MKKKRNRRNLVVTAIKERAGVYGNIGKTDKALEDYPKVLQDYELRGKTDLTLVRGMSAARVMGAGFRVGSPTTSSTCPSRYHLCWKFPVPDG